MRDGDSHEIAGKCESCGAVLLAGDLGYSYHSGEVLCEPCAPTWTEVWHDATTVLSAELGRTGEDHQQHALATIQRYSDHLAAGGSPYDKPLHPL